LGDTTAKMALMEAFEMRMLMHRNFYLLVLENMGAFENQLHKLILDLNSNLFSKLVNSHGSSSPVNSLIMATMTKRRIKPHNFR
jgi:hypothetical protein